MFSIKLKLVMNIGFIGTGKISESVINGIFKSKLKFKKIYISKRNARISKRLKKKFKKIVIKNENQSILNHADWIFLAVTPKVGEKILKELRFKSKHIIVSFISTIKLPKLKKLIKVQANIVRAIPLPFISLRKGPIPIFPTI